MLTPVRRCDERRAALLAWRRLPHPGCPGRRTSRTAAFMLRDRSTLPLERAGRMSWLDLYRAAQLAAWSGLCYLPLEALEEAVAAEQLELVACGRSNYTSWFVADGALPVERFASMALARHHAPRPAPSQPPRSANGDGSSSSGSSTRASKAAGAHTRSRPGSAAPHQSALQAETAPPTLLPQAAEAARARAAAAAGTAAAAAGTTGTAAAAAAVAGASRGLQAPEQGRQRFVFVRGVQWGAPDLSVARVWGGLAKVWPEPFGARFTSPGDGLVAHSGVAELAQHLFEELQPHLLDAGGRQLPISFAGHSLGGSLATLLTAHTALQLRAACPPKSLSCHTFGSPAVLAHERGGGGGRAVRTLSLQRHQLRNFVLQNDPIPRVLLPVDPTFALVREWGAVQQLLQLRGWLLGDGSTLSPSRFLFEVVGDLGYIRWHHAGGCEVLSLEPGDMEELALPQAGGALPRLMLQLQAWLDHHHASYAQELEAAAIKAARAAATAAAAAAAGGRH